MRRERLFLADIIQAADDIAGFIAGVEHDRFLADAVLANAVAHKLTIIGEAAAHISAETRARYPDVPWTRIVAFRNILIHAYFTVDWEIVWESATRNAPALRERIQSIIKALEQDTP